jgi:hypothetical protein
MFSNNPLARRLGRHRRTIEAPPAIEAFSDPRDVLDTLYRWGASLPWVAEAPFRRRELLVRRFVLDCPLFDCAELWFAVNAGPQDLEDRPQVLVVLPASVAHRGMALGWAARLVELEGDRIIAEVAVPTTTSEFCALQRLLEVAYSAAFARASLE